MSQSKFKIDKKVILYLLLLAAALLFPMAANRRVLNIAIITLMYVTLGESWNLLSGMSGLFSIAHALFFGLGVYGMTIPTNRLGMGRFAGVVMGLVVNTLMALLVGVIASKLSGLYFTMALIGLHQTVYSLSIQLIDLTGGSMGISMPREYLFSKTQQYYMVLTLAVASMLFYVFIRRSRIGTNFVALKENPDLARALGSNIGNWRILATVFSALMASLAGSFYALYLMSNNTEVFNASISLKIIMVVIVGGMGYVWGPVLGSSMIVLDELVRGMMPSRFAPFSVVIYAGVLIIMALLKPAGIISFFQRDEKKTPAKKERATT